MQIPFYDDFLRGSTTAIVTPITRARTQICLIGEFVPKQGDISLLRSLWAQVGCLTNHRASYCDFDWSEERLTVIIFHFFFRRITGKFLQNRYFPFQTISQYLFYCAMADLAEQVLTTQQFSVEFETKDTNRLMSIRFWEGDVLTKTTYAEEGFLPLGYRWSWVPYLDSCPLCLPRPTWSPSLGFRWIW